MAHSISAAARWGSVRVSSHRKTPVSIVPTNLSTSTTSTFRKGVKVIDCSAPHLIRRNRTRGVSGGLPERGSCNTEPLNGAALQRRAAASVEGRCRLLCLKRECLVFVVS